MALRQEARVFLSIQEVGDGLRKAGYIADSVATITVFLADSLHRPVFSEGPAGSGKTQLAYAVAQAANTKVERLQCYEGIGEDKAIGKFDESLQRLCVQLKAKVSGVVPASRNQVKQPESPFAGCRVLRVVFSAGGRTKCQNVS